jgi:acylphosphatase
LLVGTAEECNDMTERRIVRFHGRVQGVGFRYTVERIAGRFPDVAGQVFNEDDHVTLDIEGPARDVNGFVAEVFAHLPRSARIDATESDTAQVAGHRGFHIGRTR